MGRYGLGKHWIKTLLWKSGRFLIRRQISVIVAAFNADHFIGRAISSVQKQTIRDLEIIVVDDASTDNTHSVVQNLAEKDSRIKLIRLTSNTGPSGARNIGFGAAKGEWIAVLDADDAFAPDRLERLITAGHETGADIVVDNLQLFDEGAGQVVGQTSFVHEKIADLTLEIFFRKDGPPNTLPTGWVKPIIRKAPFERTRIKYNPDYRYAEDFLSTCLFDGMVMSGPIVVRGVNNQSTEI